MPFELTEEEFRVLTDRVDALEGSFPKNADTRGRSVEGHLHRRVFQFSITLMDEAAGVQAANPGTSYTEPAGFQAYRTVVDFSRFTVINCRIIVSAIANEDLTHGLEIFDGTTQLCEVTWTGISQQNALAGSWTALAATAEVTPRIRVKSGNASADVTLIRCEFQIEARPKR